MPVLKDVQVHLGPENVSLFKFYYYTSAIVIDTFNALKKTLKLVNSELTNLITAM